MDENYNAIQAKFSASLLWFLCRISEKEESNAPQEITNPFHVASTGKTTVCREVVDYLTQGVIYYRVSSFIFDRDFTSFWDLLHYFSKNGIYVMDGDSDEPVTEDDLTKKSPFNLNCHLSLMDAILNSYGNHTATIQDYINSVKKTSSFNASREMPFDLESSILLWLNKMNSHNTLHHLRKKSVARDPDTSKIRIRKDQLVEAKILPQQKSLMQALRNGVSLLSLVLYYFGDALDVQDIKFLNPLSDEDRLSNIELFRSLCARHICTSVFALRIDDFFVACDDMKPNFIALLCEILSSCEKARNEVNSNEPKPKINTTTNKDVAMQPTMVDTTELKAKHKMAHQPLLSKRSKKQLAIFHDDEKSKIQLDDFEMKESYIIGETHSTKGKGDVNPPNTSLAWNEPVKKEKISLTFKPPDSNTNQRPAIKGIQTRSAEQATHSLEELSKSKHSTPSFTSTSQPNSNIRLAWDDEHQEISQSRQTTEPVLSPTHSSLKSVYQLTCEPDLSSIEIPKEATPPPAFQEQTNSLLPIDPHEQDEDALSTILETSEPGTPLLASVDSNLTPESSPLTQTSADLFFENSPSTVKKSIEIDAGKADQSMKTTDSINKQIELFEDTGITPRHEQQSSSPQMRSPVKKSPFSVSRNSLENDFSGLSIPKQDDVAASYTVQESCTVESAIAHGLPVIDSDRSGEQGRQLDYIDLNSSHEISGMEIEQKEHSKENTSGKFQLRESSEVLDDFLLRTSVDIDKNQNKDIEHVRKIMEKERTSISQTIQFDQRVGSVDKRFMSQSYDEEMRKRYTGQGKPYQSLDISRDKTYTKSLKEDPYQINNANLNSSKSLNTGSNNQNITSSSADVNQSVNKSYSISQSGPTNQYNDQSSFTNQLSNQSDLRNSYSQPHSINTRQNINNRFLSQSFDVGQRTNISDFIPALHKDTPITNTDIVDSSKKASLLNQVSFQHWPFSKKSDQGSNGVQIVEDKNGEKRFIEQLHVLRNPSTQYANGGVLTSWVDGGVQNKERPSLEEREERLRKIQEKRLQSMESTQITTWSNLSRLQQDKEQQDALNQNEGDAPLSSRLAALRMKLEEKRRQFEEEKKTKLKEWNEERAQALQSAFFVSMDEKENKDPVNADASGTTTRQESTHGKKSDITPQDYIRQKQLEKQNSPEQQTEKKSWFFDINGQQQDIGKQKHTPNINGEGNAPTAPNPPLSSTIPDEQPSIQSTDQKVTSIRTSYQGVEPSFSQLHQSAVHINWSSYNGTEANFKPESQPTLPTNRASYHGPESSYHKETQYPTNANRSSYTEGMTPTLSALQRLQQTTNELSTHISQNSSSASEQRHQPEQNSNQKMDTIEPTPTLASTTMEAPNIPPQDETPSDIQNTHISNIPESQPLIQQEPETEDPVMEQSQNEIPLPQSEIIVMHQQTETETLNVDPVRPIPFSKEPVPSEMANDMGNLQIQDAINEIASEQPEQSSQQVGEEELGSSSPTKNSALVFTFGGEEETESAGITPEQIKKRERFLQKRQKQIEEKKLKREAELEKKRKKDEEALQEKLKMDEEKERVKKEKIRQRAQSAENHERTPHHHDNQRQHSASAFTVSMNSTSSSPSHQLRRPPSSEHLRRLQSGSPSHHATNGDGTPEESKYLEYTGPSAYQKPSGKSNRKIIQNAITYCCLSGGVNRDAKDKCLEAIEKSEANHFVVLFRDPMKFRGVYEYYPENDLVTKIYGTGPKSITSKMTEKFFRYNSGGKAFNGMLMKDLSIQCDGFTIKKELWEKKPTGGTPSKTPLRKKVR
ncbi:calmodulin-regulated spectrin-associated protein 1-like isoform X2 [Clytia hemisphaerica]